MYPFIIGLMIFIAILLVLVILAQNSKGGGLTSQFGGSAASNIIGVKKTGDLLEKLTWTFVILIMALALSTNFITPGGSAGRTNEILEKAGEQAAPVLPPANNGLLDTTGGTQPGDTTP
jgi:preprotein translocase subunit SecG